MKSYLFNKLGLGRLNTSPTPSTPTKSSSNFGGLDSPLSAGFNSPIDKKDEDEYKRYEEVFLHPFSTLIEINFESEDLVKAWNNFTVNLSKETLLISLEDSKISSFETFIQIFKDKYYDWYPPQHILEITNTQQQLTSSRPRSRVVTTTSLSNSDEILHSLQSGSVFDSTNSQNSIVKIQGFSGVIGHPIDVLSIICSYFQQQVQHVLNGRGEFDFQKTNKYNPRSLYLLEVIEILTRSHHNRLLMKDFNVLPFVSSLLKVALFKLQLTIADKRFSDKEISTLSLELAAEVESEMRTTLDFVIYVLSNCIQIFSHFCETTSVVVNSQSSTSTNNPNNTPSNNNSDTPTITTSRLTIVSSEGLKNSPNTWTQNNKNYRKQKMLTYITSREDVDFMNIIIDMLTTFRDSISKQYDGHFHSANYYDNWSFLFNFQEATMQMVRSIICTDKLKYAGQPAEYQFRDLFLSRGGCDVLVKYLGWPIEHVSILQDVEWYEIDILSLDNERLNHYFQIQYLTMKVITKLIEYNYSYLRLFGKQGFARIRETGLWISFFFTLNKDYDSQTQTLRNNPLPQLGSVVRSRSGSLDLANFRFPPTPISNSSGLGVKSFPCPGFISKTMNERVMQFFDCLRKLVKLSTIISFPKTVHSSTPGTPSNNFTFPDTSFTTHLNNTEQDQHLQRKLSRLLFSFFIDDNEKDQMTDKSLRKLKMVSDFPLYFMDSINRLVSESQTALDVMVSNGLYDVLFSEYFYLYGGALNQLNRFEKSSQNDLQKTSDEEKFIFTKNEISSLVECTSAVLRSSVIDFMKYTATIRGRNNVEECRKLIDIMQLYKENSLIISEVGLCLLDIIRQNHDITQESLFSIKAMSVLSHVVGKQHGIIRKFETENQQSQYYQVEYTEDHLRAIEARNIMLNILDFTLTFENSLSLALQNHNTLETLFKVILDPTLKNFVLVHIRQLMNTKNVEHSHEFEILLTYFTEVFPIIMDNPTQQNLQLLMEMLAAVQKGLCGSNKKLLQTQFRDKLDKFMHLLNLDIPTSIPPNNTEFITRHFLAIEVIRTLTTLISDNSKSKQHFKSILGYDTFKNLILHCEQNNPSPDIFNVLFDMLADGEFDSETKYAIQNPDVARLIFHLSMHCDLSYISSLVAKFSCLVEKSTNNRNICCSVGLISSLLDLLTRFEKESFSEEKTVSDIVNLIETIGRHSITVKELKGFLGLIKRQSDRDQSDFLSLLLRALNNMTQSSPDAFFDFNGTNSGLVLPTIDNRVWPNTKGYSVSMWVRVESFVESRPSAPNSNPMTPISSVKSLSFTTDLQRKESFQFVPFSTTYKPRLISFYNSEGQGFEVYFEHNFMKIVVQHSQKKQYTEVFDFKYEPKKWYHIVLTHSYGKGPFSFSKNELRLYIDGVSVSKIQLKYPSLHKPLDKCMIGSSYLVNESLQQGSTPTHKRQTSSTSENPNFNGQMGTICVFDETLLPNIIQLIYSLGYNYMNCFQPTDSVLTKQSSQQEYLQLFDGSITQKIVLCYSPKARANYNKVCLNNTPEAFYQLQLHNGLISGVENVPQIKSDIHQTMLNSRILNGTQLCVTHNAKDIIGCLGGIKVLFPLFLQMDRLSHTDQVISEKADPFLVNTLFSLIIDLLNDHNDNLEDMARCRGFLVISFLLKQISPQHLTRNTVALIPSLLSCVRDHSVLYSDIVNYFVFNFRLWIYTDVEVQKLLFQQLLDLDISNQKKDNFTKIREILGVQKLLDLMRWFYWYERAKSNSTESEYQLGTEKICNPATGAVLGQRPSQENIYEIRQRLTRLLKCLTSKSAEIVIVNNDERLTTTTNTILTTTTSISYPELEAVINLLADCNDNMQYSDVVVFVLELLLSPDGAVIADMLSNMKAYQVFVQLLYTHHEPTRLNILKCIGQMLILNPKLRQRVFAETSYGFTTITNILTYFNFTIQTYGVLRDIFLGCISLNQRDILEYDGFEQTEQSYKVQAVLQPIFRLLVNTQPNVKHHILQNFKIVLKSNRAKDCLLQQVGWQEWLLNIICVSGISDASLPSEVGQTAQFELCKDIVIELIAILLYHSLKTVKKGWRDIEDTICQVILLKDREDIEGIEEILGSIYKRILDEYISDIQGEKITANYNDRNSPILDNFVHLATFIEEYMFYFDAIYQSVSGTWMRKTTESGTGVLGTLRSIVVGANNNRGLQEPGIIPSQNNQEDFVVIDTSSVSGASHSEVVPSTPDGKRSDQLSTNSPSSASNPLTYNVEDEINMRRDENNKWIDLSIAEKLIVILSAWKLNTVSNYSSLRSVVQGGKRLRDGGTLRITLRLIRYCLRESPTLDSSLLDCIKRINQRDVESEKEILRFSELWAVTGDIENNDDFHTRLMFILAFLFDILSRLLEKKQEKEALFVFITIREIFMTRKEYLEQALTTDDDKSILTDDPVFSTKKKADLADYLQVIHSKSWKFAWTRFFVPAVRLTEKLESAFLEEIITRRKFTLHRLYDHIREVEVAMFDLDKKMDSDIRSTLDNIRRAERERIKKERSSYEEFDLLASHYWKQTMRNVADERGIWGSQNDSVKWKLDKCHNSKFIRTRLVRNFSGVDHKDATIKKTDKSVIVENTITNRLLEIKEKGSFFIPKLSVINNEIEDASSEDGTSEVAAATVISAQQPSTSNISEDIQISQKPIEREKTILKDVDCDLITPMAGFSGKMEITNKRITWTPDKENHALNFGLDSERVSKLIKKPTENTFTLDSIAEIRIMRYRLRKTALEFIFVDESSVLYNFNVNERNKIFNKIISQKCPNLKNVEKSFSPMENIQRSPWTKKWQLGKISNFDYLMILNMYAGRTFNDLSQYPIFPWVIADYTSPVLDFSKESTFRDLSKPMGVLNPDKVRIVEEKYQTLASDSYTTPYHYGSHYSTSAYVTYYLIRLEPYTTLARVVQGGKFDHADRMFESITQTFDHCLNGEGDHKELIPEFFYMPEFLRKPQDLELGEKQNGIHIGDVLLPNWAKTPEDFIRIHREALESEYVSQHLPEWIDLIFGYKQRGSESVKAYNVFPKLTYEGNISFDPQEFYQNMATIDSFGQTPSQLFLAPHPKKSIIRRDKHETLLSLTVQCSKQINTTKVSPIVLIKLFQSDNNITRLCVVNEDGFIYTTKVTNITLQTILSEYTLFNNCKTIGFPLDDPVGLLSSSTETNNFVSVNGTNNSTKQRRSLASLPKQSSGIRSNVSACKTAFAIPSSTNPNSVKDITLISCRHHDNSFRISKPYAQPLQTKITLCQQNAIWRHKDLVTCCSICEEDKYLVTGSRDTTVMVWDIMTNDFFTSQQPSTILYGHDDEVTCVVVCNDLDNVISGSRDGTIIIHSLRRGKYIRTIKHPNGGCINSIAVARECRISHDIEVLGRICVYSNDDMVLYLYSANGQLLARAETNGVLHCMIIFDSKYVIYGGDHSIVIRDLHSLKVIHKFALSEYMSPIRTIEISNDEQLLFAGLDSGQLVVLGVDTLTNNSVAPPSPNQNI